MRVAVVGGGAVGVAIGARLAEGGDAPTLVARASTATAGAAAAGLPVRQAAIEDPSALAEAFQGAEVVVHTAGASLDENDAERLAWVHVAGTENVIAAAKHAGVRRLVHLSCASVTVQRGPRMNWDEGRALAGVPCTAYARSKLLGEEIALASHGALEVVVLRPAWLWGPGMRNMERLSRVAAAGAFSLPRGGTRLVETTYVDDLVDAIASAAEVSAAAGRLYYVTDGALETSGAFFRDLAEALGLPAPRGEWPEPLASWRRPQGGFSETERAEWRASTRFDTQRARRELDWAPTTNRNQLFEALARARRR